MLKDIFKAYDIRGVYGEDLTEEVAYKIGKAFVELLDEKKIVVGRDMRASSTPLFEALTKGIIDQGGSVIDIGLSSTPMFYFAVNHLSADGGVMITASHNPAEYNGFKFVSSEAKPIAYDTGIGQMEVVVVSEDFKDATEKGTLETTDVRDAFVSFTKSLIGNVPPLKIVVDTSNGMGGYTFPHVFEGTDLQFTHLNQDLDGNFPNHEANPLKEEAYTQLSATVVSEGADFGVMFDGDADRVGFCDESGKIIGNDIIEALLVREFPKATILYDVRSTKAIVEEAEAVGSKAMMCRVGHSYIKQMMRETDAVFAGELAGHFYFKDHYFTESTQYALALVAQIVGREGKKLSEIVKPLQRYYQSGEINSKVTSKEAVLTAVKEEYGDGDLSEVDGVRVTYPTWWFSVRASNTEPLLRLVLEADSKGLMEEKVAEVLKLIRK